MNVIACVRCIYNANACSTNVYTMARQVAAVLAGTAWSNARRALVYHIATLWSKNSCTIFNKFNWQSDAGGCEEVDFDLWPLLLRCLPHRLSKLLRLLRFCCCWVMHQIRQTKYRNFSMLLLETINGVLRVTYNFVRIFYRQSNERMQPKTSF